jgi:8-oxo-dGTP diphosphatase
MSEIIDAGKMRKAGGILIVDRKFMLEKHGGNDTYVVPGGKLEAGETARQALVREFNEEFHVGFNPDDAVALGTFEARAVHSPDRIVSIDAFLIPRWIGDMRLDDGIEEVIWINSKNVQDYKVSSIALEILPLLATRGLID